MADETPTISPPQTRQVAYDWLEFLDAKWCRTCDSTHMTRAQFDALLHLARTGADMLPEAPDA